MLSTADPQVPLREQAPPAIVREPWLVDRVVFVGGHPGCGKTMLTPIVSSLARVEVQKFNYAIEHLCALYWLGTLERDAGVAMVRMQTDLDIYNLAMARETNFRPSDVSSVFKNPGTWRYLRRLFLPGDAAAAERVVRERPILHITTHNALVISPLLFEALGERLRIIEVVRHPLYMIKQWSLYIERYGTDVRDFTVWFESQGQTLPFFACGWEDQYLQANPMDRVIYSIQHLTQLEEQVLRSCTESQRAQVTIVPFERFVLDPWPHVRRLEALLGTTMTSLTRRELKRQNVPRRMVAEGIPRPIYKQYGWRPPEPAADERKELAVRRQFAAEGATPAALEVLDALSREYEARYGDGWLSA